MDPAETNRVRLREDEELVRTLELYGWAPEAWSIVAEWIAGYGYDVIKGWLFNRKIYPEMAAIGRPVPRCPEEWLSEDEIYSLTTDTVVAAVTEFEKVLRGNRWDAAKGASLRTYFVRQCKFQFANIYRSWHKQRSNQQSLAHDPSMDGLVPSTESTVITELETERLLRQMPERTAHVFRLHAQGYAHAEVAKLTGLADAKSVENLIRRERQKWNGESRERNGSRQT